MYQHDTPSFKWHGSCQLKITTWLAEIEQWSGDAIVWFGHLEEQGWGARDICQNSFGKRLQVRSIGSSACALHQHGPLRPKVPHAQSL